MTAELEEGKTRSTEKMKKLKENTSRNASIFVLNTSRCALTLESQKLLLARTDVTLASASDPKPLFARFAAYRPAARTAATVMVAAAALATSSAVATESEEEPPCGVVPLFGSVMLAATDASDATAERRESLA